jgi:hypothetical protein
MRQAQCGFTISRRSDLAGVQSACFSKRCHRSGVSLSDSFIRGALCDVLFFLRTQLRCQTLVISRRIRSMALQFSRMRFMVCVQLRRRITHSACVLLLRRRPHCRELCGGLRSKRLKANRRSFKRVGMRSSQCSLSCSVLLLVSAELRF